MAAVRPSSPSRIEAHVTRRRDLCDRGDATGSTSRPPAVVVALVLLLCMSLGLGCAARTATTPTGPPVTIVVHAAPELSAQLEQDLHAAQVPVDLRFAQLPQPPPVSRPRLGFEERLATARTRYIEADFEGCEQALRGESLETALLGDTRRNTVGRLLLWRIACDVGAAETSRARRTADRFAAYDLEIPRDVEAVTPEVEALLGEAMTAASEGPRASLHLASDPTGATVAIDGRPAACNTPCDLDLVPGDHVVRLYAAGSQPVVQRLKVSPEGERRTLSLPPAAPVEVARQWAIRYATSPAIDSADSVRLLSRAVRAQRLILITAEGDEALRLRGVLSLDERISARSERDTTRAKIPQVAPALLEDLLVQGQVVAPPKPLVRRWGFWLALGLSAAGAATITAIALDRDPPRTEVRFQ